MTDKAEGSKQTNRHLDTPVSFNSGAEFETIGYVGFGGREVLLND